MNRLATMFAASGFCVLAGCGQFNGNIGFENKSDREIWVDSVDGFKRAPHAGALIKDGRKDSSLGAMNLPEKVTIHWSYETDKSDKTSEVSLKGVGTPKGDNEFLLFVFTDKAEWTVTLHKYNFK